MIDTTRPRWPTIDRDSLAASLHWDKVMWVASIVNVAAMLPQLWQLIQTQETEGLAISMFVTYFVLQIVFALEGFFNRRRAFTTCMLASATVTGTILCLVLYYRHFA